MDVTRRMKDLVQHSSPCKRTNTAQRVSYSSTAKKPCYSDDDIEPTLENKRDLKHSDVSKATLPCLMTNSPEGKKLSPVLSLIRSPLRPQKCITSSDEHNRHPLSCLCQRVAVVTTLIVRSIVKDKRHRRTAMILTCFQHQRRSTKALRQVMR